MRLFRKLWNVMTTVLVILLILLALAFVGVRLVGYTPYHILSGSMEPNYHVGALVYTEKVDYRELQVGDVISFLIDEKTIVTHRIIEIRPDEEDPTVLRYVTQGDSNASPDAALVHYKNVLGRAVFTIPFLGYLVDFIQTPPTQYFAIAIGALIVMLNVLPDLFAEEEQTPAQEESRRGQSRKRKPEKLFDLGLKHN